MASRVKTLRETVRRARKLLTLQRIAPNIQTLEIIALVLSLSENINFLWFIQPSL